MQSHCLQTFVRRASERIIEVLVQLCFLHLRTTVLAMIDPEAFPAIDVSIDAIVRREVAHATRNRLGRAVNEREYCG